MYTLHHSQSIDLLSSVHSRTLLSCQRTFVLFCFRDRSGFRSVEFSKASRVALVHSKCGMPLGQVISCACKRTHTATSLHVCVFKRTATGVLTPPHCSIAVVYEIHGPCCVCDGPCCDVFFDITPPGGDREQSVGVISKRAVEGLEGYAKQMFTDADNFSADCKKSCPAHLCYVLLCQTKQNNCGTHTF